MTAIEFIVQSAKYDYWANVAAFEAISIAGAPDKPAGIYGHIINAQRIWHNRIVGGKDSRIDAFPSVNMTEFQHLTNEIRGLWAEALNAASDNWLSSEISYQNTSGKQFTTIVSDILSHVFLHSAYHRGQIALELRSLGANPPITDFIAFSRRLQPGFQL